MNKPWALVNHIACFNQSFFVFIHEARPTLSLRLWAHPHFRTGAELENVQRAELAHWEPIIKTSGFKPE